MKQQYNNHYDTAKSLKPFTISTPTNPGSIAPPDCTREETTPVVTPGFWPCRDLKKNKWVDVEDHRTELGFVNGVFTEINEVGPYPDGWSTTPPEPELSREEQIIRRLSEIDRESIRPLRAVVDGSATDRDKTKLQTLEEEAENLRSELSQFASKA